jgi:phosphatidylglycerol:prolipoprotein diacylglycerol transferase
MKPILFYLGSIPIYSFGVLMSLAFVVAGWVMQRDFVRKHEPRELAWEIVGFGLIGGIFGARLNQAVHHWPDFVAAPLAFLTGRSGLVWYGGVIGGALATVWPIRRSGVRYASALDTGALGLTIGLLIGRIGCHLSGDGDWGTPTNLPWGVAYVNGTVRWPHPPGVFVHPTALYEMIALLGIFALLLHLRSRVMPGALFAIYLSLSGLTRLLVEIIRTNPPVLLGLTEAQWTSIVLSGAAAVWMWWHRLVRLSRHGAGHPNVAGTFIAQIGDHGPSTQRRGERRRRQGWTRYADQTGTR